MKSVKDLNEEISSLKKRVVELEDENSSLWFLLDELEKSNIGNEKYKKNFEEVFKNLRQISLMTHSKVESA